MDKLLNILFKSNDFYKAKSCPHARLAIKLLKIAEKETLSKSDIQHKLIIFI